MRTKLETCALNWNKFYQFEKSVRTKFENSFFIGQFFVKDTQAIQINPEVDLQGLLTD